MERRHQRNGPQRVPFFVRVRHDVQMEVGPTDRKSLGLIMLGFYDFNGLHGPPIIKTTSFSHYISTVWRQATCLKASSKKTIEKHTQHDKGDNDVCSVTLKCKSDNRKNHTGNGSRNQQQHP